ncbi:MAG: glycosyltransferase [Candidatus Omnitrophota bacterium]|jgi:glycosyltransferase involved in cell wall biosynthesis
MKILNIIPGYPPVIGGSESWCTQACRYLSKKGIIARVAAMNMRNLSEAFDRNFQDDGHVKLGGEDYDEGVYIRRYALWKPWSGLISARIVRFIGYKLGLAKTQLGDIFMTSPNSFQMYRDLFNQIKEVDVVLLHTLPFFHNLAGYLIARICRKPVVAVPYFHPANQQFERKIFFRMLNGCDAIIAISGYEKEQLVLRGVAAEKIHVLGCAIDPKISLSQSARAALTEKLRAKHEIPNIRKKVIFIGRKELYKGIFLLIDALNRLVDEEDFILELFLIGPDTADFNRIYPAIYKSERLKIINLGVVSDQEKECFISMSDVLVLPSEFESFGIVFLEAWKYSKPVIGMSHGAVPKVIAGAGLCAKYGDVDDLKRKIKTILCDPELAKTMGAKGRERLENEYSLEAIYGNVRRILYDLKKYKRKIMIVSQLFPPHFVGGSEIAAYEQSKRLKELGWQLRIFAGRINNSLKRYSINKYKSRPEITWVNLHDRDLNQQRNANFDKDELREAFRKEINDFAPDIVHFHNVFGFSLGMVDDCSSMNIPIVMTLHDYWGICPKNLLLDNNGRICNSTDGQCDICNGDMISYRGEIMPSSKHNQICIQYYKRANLLISPSRYLADRFIERDIPDHKFQVIKYGIDLSRFKAGIKSVNKKIVFAFMGQIIWHKGTDIFLQALSLLGPGARRNVKALVIGNGQSDYLDYCRGLTRGLNFVKFIPKLDNNKIHAAYGKIDVLVVPSRWPENSPLVIQEAMACGIPVIASDFGAIPELVKDGESGFLFKVNDPGSLAQAMRKIIENPDKIKAMSRSCLEQAKENDLYNTVSEIASNYQRIIKHEDHPGSS